MQRIYTGNITTGEHEPELDTLYYHINDAEFSLGDFELRYRMHHRAGRAIKAVLERAVEKDSVSARRPPELSLDLMLAKAAARSSSCRQCANKLSHEMTTSKVSEIVSLRLRNSATSKVTSTPNSVDSHRTPACQLYPMLCWNTGPRRS